MTGQSYWMELPTAEIDGTVDFVAPEPPDARSRSVLKYLNRSRIISEDICRKEVEEIPSFCKIVLKTG